MRNNNIDLLQRQVNHLVTQAYHDIFTLSATNDPLTKQQILQRLWDAISNLHFLSELLVNQALTASEQLPPSTTKPPKTQEPLFTTEELTSFNGKNGKPAYIAVKGIVYDVTNNAAWAAATHFGLSAGNNYTDEFASCHSGQESILAALPRVGRLA